MVYPHNLGHVARTFYLLFGRIRATRTYSLLLRDQGALRWVPNMVSALISDSQSMEVRILVFQRFTAHLLAISEDKECISSPQFLPFISIYTNQS